jgi:hypothetical protein
MVLEMVKGEDVKFVTVGKELAGGARSQGCWWRLPRILDSLAKIR